MDDTLGDPPPWLDLAQPVELHVGLPDQRPLARFALRTAPRGSRRPLFLPPQEGITLPAAVLPLVDRAGQPVDHERVAAACPGAALHPAQWVVPESTRGELRRIPAVWLQGLGEAEIDAAARALQLRPGLLLTGDERCVPLGHQDGRPRHLVPLPRVVLHDRQWIADNTDHSLSMSALLDGLVVAIRDHAYRHVRLATGYLYQRGLVRLLRLLRDHRIEDLRLLFSGRTDAATAHALTRAFSDTMIEAAESTGEGDLADLCRAALESGRLAVRVYPDAFLHAKLFLAYEPHPHGGLAGRAVVGSSNLSQGGMGHGGNLELDVRVEHSETIEHLVGWFDARWVEADEPEPPLLDVVEQWRPQPEPTFLTPGLADVWRAGQQRRLAAPDAYLAFLAALYGRRTIQVRPVDIPPYPDDVERAIHPSPEQVEGVKNLQYRLRAARLAFLADSVGLGKTVTALGAAWFLQRAGLIERFAVIAPRKLHRQWLADAARIGMARGTPARSAVECLNRHQLERFETERAAELLTDYRLLLVDEAHETLRNRGNKLWRHLRAWLQRDPQAMLLLISATPWNNSREDIFNYLALGWADYRLPARHFPALDTAPLSADLALFRGAQSQGARHFLELDGARYKQLFGTAFVQRTRHAVAQRYGSAPDFPEREIHPETTPPSEPHDAFFADLDRTLQALGIPYREPFAAMQRALAAVDPRPGGSAVEAPGPSNLHGAFVLQLYKRAESSLYALAVSLEKVVQRLRAFRTTLQAIENAADPRQALAHWLKEVYLRLDPLTIGAEDMVLDGAGDAEEAGDEDLAALRLRPSSAEDARRVNLESLLSRVDAEQVVQAVRHLVTHEVEADLRHLDTLRAKLTPSLCRSDPKALQLFRPVNTHYAGGHKPILVAAYADTATRFFLRLVQRLPDARIGLALGGGEGWVYHPGSHRAEDLTDDEWRASLAWSGAERRARVLGGTGRARAVDRDDLLAAFAPRSQARGAEAIDEVGGEVDVLVGSEAISVGQNLQDSTALIHLDLPWNPMVLEQRIGRVDRRGGGREDDAGRKVVDVHYCWSGAAVEAEVRLRDRLKEKIRGALQDTHFDELLLHEALEEVRQARDEADRRQRLTHVLGQRQRELVEARERVEGTDDQTGAEIDGLRILSEWQSTRADTEAAPEPVVACGQRGAGDGPAAEWLLTLKMVPVGASGRPLDATLYAHVAVPAARTVEILRGDLDAVVAALTGAGAPSAAPGVDRRTWTQLVSELDVELQAARKRTLAAHNAEVQATVARRLQAQGPRPVSEGLKLAANRARTALYNLGRSDPRLRQQPHAPRVRALIEGVLKPAEVWRLAVSRDEDTVRQWLQQVADRPRWFFTDGFEQVWAAIFEGLDENGGTENGGTEDGGTTEHEQMELSASTATETSWQDLRVEVLAASFVRE